VVLEPLASARLSKRRLHILFSLRTRGPSGPRSFDRQPLRLGRIAFRVNQIARFSVRTR
jgi:hypothetical protein